MLHWHGMGILKWQFFLNANAELSWWCFQFLFCRQKCQAKKKQNPKGQGRKIMKDLVQKFIAWCALSMHAWTHLNGPCERLLANKRYVNFIVFPIACICERVYLRVEHFDLFLFLSGVEEGPSWRMFELAKFVGDVFHVELNFLIDLVQVVLLFDSWLDHWWRLKFKDEVFIFASHKS